MARGGYRTLPFRSEQGIGSVLQEAIHAIQCVASIPTSSSALRERSAPDPADVLSAGSPESKLQAPLSKSREWRMIFKIVSASRRSAKLWSGLRALGHSLFASIVVCCAGAEASSGNIPLGYAIAESSALTALLKGAGGPGEPSMVFHSGFEASDRNCVTLPDQDDDGLLDPGCLQIFVPPNPSDVAPPIDQTVTTEFVEANNFLIAGPAPIQRGVAPNVVERYRAAVTRGRVLDGHGEPLPGVLVRVLDHPEFGYTYSREDGFYDLLVNGGGDLILDFQTPNYLRAQRRVQTPWRDWALVDEILSGEAWAAFGFIAAEADRLRLSP